MADENIPLDTVRALRAAGHDVYSATEAAPGAPDLEHLKVAIAEDRLILTFDTDFGELVVRSAHRPQAGVMLLRLVPSGAAEITELLLDLLARPEVTWHGHLSVVDREYIRQRPL